MSLLSRYGICPSGLERATITFRKATKSWLIMGLSGLSWWVAAKMTKVNTLTRDVDGEADWIEESVDEEADWAESLVDEGEG